MMSITQSVLEKEIARLSATVESQRRLLVALVYEVGRGKNVSISKGNQKQADLRIGSIEFRQMSSGELRFTVKKPDKEKE